MMFMPVFMLFYNDLGLELRQITLLQSTYYLTIAVFEIPSGYLSDVYGRRNTLLLGTIATAIGFGMYAFESSFTWFMVAEILLGVGMSFVSGTDSALLFETLKAGGKESQYIHHEGRVVAIGNFAEGMAGILGGLLAGWSLRYPYIGQCVISLLAVPVAASLKEIPSHINRKSQPVGAILKYLRYEAKDLTGMILFSSVLGAATLLMAKIFLQPTFRELNMPVFWFGVAWTALQFLVGISAYFSSRADRRFGRRNMVWTMWLLIAAGFWLVAAVPGYAVLCVLALFYLVRGLATPLLRSYINLLTPDHMRATILSIRSFVIRCMAAVVSPLLGWMADVYTLRYALILAGIMFLLMGGITLLMLIRLRAFDRLTS